MLPIHVEMLMGHDTGISMSYYRPTEKTLLEDYLKAVDLLIINDYKVIVEKEVSELREKSKDNEYIVKAKLQEKDQEIQILKQQMTSMQESQKEILGLLKDPARLLEVLNEN
jgi:S-adenosylmethionine:tRNA-ribosyltransferase-isomerase (queuine synthetase)